jgi:hypothetical protein
VRSDDGTLFGGFASREDAEAYAKGDCTFVDGVCIEHGKPKYSIVRVLSHEEAKRKAAALALVNFAQVMIDLGFDDDDDAVTIAHQEAESLWPALFHAGDSKTPRGK